MNQSINVGKLFVRPFVVPLGVIALMAILIVGVGEALLANVDHDIPTDSLRRVELWVAIIPSLLIFGAAWFLAHSPKGTVPVLEKDVVIGDRPIFAPDPPPVDVLARSGPLGTTDDIAAGYTLYAQIGPLARVVGLVPGSVENGKRFRGYMYANGLYGASPQLWIPYEAVYAVYPETQSAFLAIKGDETEHYGWNKMPESMARTPNRGHTLPRN